MKTKTSKLLVIMLAALISLTACTSVDPWQSATYKEDTALGEGSITFTLIVEVEEHAVTFTVSTDEENLASALMEVNLVDGEDGAYGLYLKSVNGVVADYDANGAWWGVYVGDKAADTGVSGITVENGGTYKLVYSK